MNGPERERERDRERAREREAGRARTGQRECAREQANKAQQNMCDKFFFLLFALASVPVSLSTAAAASGFSLLFCLLCGTRIE